MATQDPNIWEWFENMTKGNTFSFDNYVPENTIDLQEIEPGVFRKAQPHEDIRHPDYYEVLKDMEKTKNKRL